MKTFIEKILIQNVAIIILMSCTVLHGHELTDQEIKNIKYEFYKNKLDLYDEKFQELKSQIAESATIARLLAEYNNKRDLNEQLYHAKIDKIKNDNQQPPDRNAIKKTKKEFIKREIKQAEALSSLLLKEMAMDESRVKHEFKENLLNRRHDEMISILIGLFLLNTLSVDDVIKNKEVIEDVYAIISRVKSSKEFEEYQANPNRQTGYEVLMQLKKYARKLPNYSIKLYNKYEDSFRSEQNDESLEKLVNLLKQNEYFIICLKGLQKTHLHLNSRQSRTQINWILSSFTPG